MCVCCVLVCVCVCVCRKLQQASVVVNRYASQQAELESSLAQSRAELERVQRALAEKEAEVSQTRAERGASESSLSSRTAQLEAELTALRASSASASSTVAELQAELSAARGKVEALEEKAKGKPSAKCFISVEDAGKSAAGDADAPLFPGVLESGRAVKFTWSLSGTVRIQWYRSFRGSDWQLIPGKVATRPTYNINADDIGACLRAEATHTENGRSVYAETGPVHPSSLLVRSLAELVRKLDASFQVESANAAEADKQRRILLNKEKIKLQDAKGKTVAKKEWGEAVRVLIDGDSERRFSVQIEQNGPVVNYIANNGKLRDLIIVTMRTFVWLITKHAGKLNKELDHDIALSLYVRTLSEQANVQKMGVVPASPAGKRTSVGGGAGAKAPAGATGKGQQGTPASKKAGESGSTPSTPVSHSAATPGQPSNGRRQSGAGEDDWGGFGLPPPAAAGGGLTTAGVTVSQPIAANGGGGGGGGGGPPRAVKRNADGDEVDDEGFIVTKQRGFDEYATHHTHTTHTHTHTHTRTHTHTHTHNTTAHHV